jgi:WD40 repeat protein
VVSQVACDMAWHPYRPLLAVITGDGGVRVVDLVSDSWSGVIFREVHHAAQRIAWQPYSGTSLAVASAAGVCVWCFKSNQRWRVLSAPAVDLAWAPSGKQLAVASTDGLFICDLGEAPLVRLVSSSVGRVAWSPSGSQLVVSAASGTRFAVWRTTDWTRSVWHAPRSTVTAAAWSPDGESMLFVCEHDSRIYALRGGQAHIVFDCDETCLLNDEELSLGGPVHNLLWNPRGLRVAVTFAASPAILILSATFADFLELNIMCVGVDL